MYLLERNFKRRRKSQYDEIVHGDKKTGILDKKVITEK